MQRLLMGRQGAVHAVSGLKSSYRAAVHLAHLPVTLTGGQEYVTGPGNTPVYMPLQSSTASTLTCPTSWCRSLASGVLISCRILLAAGAAGDHLGVPRGRLALGGACTQVKVISIRVRLFK
jgi:hypothetical protein